MAVTYDPKVISEFAQKLYAQASGIIAVGFLFGGAVGVVVGIVFVSLVKLNGLIALFVALVGAFVGMSSARARAFALKLQAQQALCQLMIEANTRPNRGITASPAPASTLAPAVAP